MEQISYRRNKGSPACGLLPFKNIEWKPRLTIITFVKHLAKYRGWMCCMVSGNPQSIRVPDTSVSPICYNQKLRIRNKTCSYGQFVERKIVEENFSQTSSSSSPKKKSSLLPLSKLYIWLPITLLFFPWIGRSIPIKTFWKKWNSSTVNVCQCNFKKMTCRRLNSNALFFFLFLKCQMLPSTRHNFPPTNPLSASHAFK